MVPGGGPHPSEAPLSLAFGASAWLWRPGGSRPGACSFPAALVCKPTLCSLAMPAPKPRASPGPRAPSAPRPTISGSSKGRPCSRPLRAGADQRGLGQVAQCRGQCRGRCPAEGLGTWPREGWRVELGFRQTANQGKQSGLTLPLREGWGGAGQGREEVGCPCLSRAPQATAQAELSAGQPCRRRTGLGGDAPGTFPRTRVPLSPYPGRRHRCPGESGWLLGCQCCRSC